jgi:hypothetical protein
MSSSHLWWTQRSTHEKSCLIEYIETITKGKPHLDCSRSVDSLHGKRKFNNGIPKNGKLAKIYLDIWDRISWQIECNLQTYEAINWSQSTIYWQSLKVGWILVFWILNGLSTEIFIKNKLFWVCYGLNHSAGSKADMEWSLFALLLEHFKLLKMHDLSEDTWLRRFNYNRFNPI